VVLDNEGFAVPAPPEEQHNNTSKEGGPGEPCQDC
jgi:hypothetical protein